MKEVSTVYSAIYSGISDLKICGTTFNPDATRLASELMLSKHYGGTIVLPSGNDKGFELIKYTADKTDIKDDGVTVDDFWECTKEHYGLTAVTGLFSTAAIPIKKVTLGHKVYAGASPYTNLTSHVGLKFFPRTNLKSGTMIANAAKKTFGTIRLFGVVGRALPFAAIGFAVFDVISIGKCVYEKNK